MTIGDEETNKNFYSSHCQKSGFLIVLLSALLVSLSSNWKYFYLEQFAVDYLYTRILLDVAVESFENDDCWTKFKQKNPTAEEHSLKALMELNCADFKTMNRCVEDAVEAV